MAEKFWNFYSVSWKHWFLDKTWRFFWCKSCYIFVKQESHEGDKFLLYKFSSWVHSLTFFSVHAKNFSEIISFLESDIFVKGFQKNKLLNHICLHFITLQIKIEVKNCISNSIISLWRHYMNSLFDVKSPFCVKMCIEFQCCQLTLKNWFYGIIRLGQIWSKLSYQNISKSTFVFLHKD